MVAPTDNSTNPIYKGRVHYTETAILNGNTANVNRLFSINRYETFGRLDRVQTDNHLGGFDNAFLYYDFADNQKREIRFHSQNNAVSDFTTDTKNYFDHQGRKIRQQHLKTPVFTQEVCSLAYNIKDLLVTKQLGGIGATGYLQEINYDYLPNRFLSGINSNSSASDLFVLFMNYDQVNSGIGIVPQYDGNISGLSWSVQGGTQKTFTYNYDFLNRLTAANDTSPDNDYGTTYGYDARGNFTNITRQGVYDDGSSLTPQQIDNMAFMPHAGTNKVKNITDAAPCPANKVIHQALDNTEMHAVELTITADNPVNNNADITYQAGTSITLQAGFHAKAGTDFIAKIADCPTSGYETDGFVQRSTNNYLYDNNGNQTSDPNKGIITEYNYLNLPHKVTFNNGNVIEWLYLAGGTKVQKTVKRDGVIAPIVKQDYIGGIEYQKDTLDAIYIEDGRLTFKSGDFEAYQYYLTDHLGNNRVVFKDDGAGQAEIVQNQDFYPYGLQMKGNFTQSTGKEDRYKFNGFERNTDFRLGLDLTKYRTYDPAVGRWLQIDPKQELFASWTPYKFGMNNPILFNDPNGDCEICKEALINTVVFVAGAANAIGSNLTGNFPGTRGDPSDFGAYSNAAEIGQQTGDVLSFVGGTTGTILGTLAATGSAVTTPVTGPVGGGATLTFSAGAIASANVATTALENLTGNNGIVQSNDLDKRAARLNKKDRSGKDFTRAGKDVVKKQNAEKNNGQMKCEGCGNDVIPAKRHQRGVKPPKNEAHVDHINRKRNSGRGNPDNGQVLCRGCNLEKG